MSRLADGPGPQSIRLGEIEVVLTEPIRLPTPGSREVVRSSLLERCRCAWSIVASQDTAPRFDASSRALPFRLEGPPGSGKNVLVYQLARDLRRELYVQNGHDALAPEDLSLLVLPGVGRRGRQPLRVQASPLATALIRGGLFLFDDIHSVPERTLAALAPVLDGRREIYSAATGLWIRSDDEEAARSFRFCCIAASGAASSLPAFLEQRTAPLIHVPMPTADELKEILDWSVGSPRVDLEPFRNAQDQHLQNELDALTQRVGMSVRSALVRIQDVDIGCRFDLSMAMIRAERWTPAAEAFEAIASELPANDRIGMLASNNRAHCLIELGQLDEANEICVRLLQQNPDFGYALCTQGDVYAARRRGAAEPEHWQLTKSACDQYRRALQVAGSHPTVRHHAERRLAELRCAPRKRSRQEKQR